MPGSILGTAVRRVEDPELLVGSAQFVDDIPIDGVVHLHFVRSSYAHARLVSIDTSRAWAYDERTKWRCTTPSIGMSSTNWALPTSSSGSSTRRTAVPRIDPGIARPYRPRAD